MTLNQVESRLKALALSHRQIRSCEFGNVSDFLNKPDNDYPVCFFQDSNGTIDLSQRVKTFNYKICLLDLVNNSVDTASNEREVMSDMIEVSVDLLALIDDPNYQEWKLSVVPFSFIGDEINSDIVAGVAADVSISVLTVKDKCAAPKDGPFVFENEFSKEFE